MVVQNLEYIFPQHTTHSTINVVRFPSQHTNDQFNTKNLKHYTDALPKKQKTLQPKRTVNDLVISEAGARGKARCGIVRGADEW